jgi:hypothetical protein
VQKITWVIRDRSEGKTSALIRWLLSTNSIRYNSETGKIAHTKRAIVVGTDRQAAWLAQQIQYALPISVNEIRARLIYTIRDVQLGMLRGLGQDIELAIDDLDELLGEVFRTELPITMIAATGELYEQERDHA